MNNSLMSLFIAIIVLLVGGFLLYPYLETREAIRDAVAVSWQQTDSDNSIELHRIQIHRFYSTNNPSEYWVELTVFWQNADDIDHPRTLYFVNIDDHTAVSLADIYEETTYSNISKDEIAVMQIPSENVRLRYKHLSIYRSDEGEPKWVLTAYSDARQEIGGMYFNFRNINEEYRSGDDYLRPLFESQCVENDATGKHMIDLIGIVLDNKFHTKPQYLYFEEPITVECKEEAYAFAPTGSVFVRPIENSLEYEYPFILTTLPGNITLKIDVEKLRTLTRSGWSEPEAVVQAFKNGERVELKE